jgi:hypothetical protein
MLAIRRFVRGSLTLADTGEQPFLPLCAINVPLTYRLPVPLTIEISPANRPRPGRRFGWNRSTDLPRWRKCIRGRFAAYLHRFTDRERSDALSIFRGVLSPTGFVNLALASAAEVVIDRQ